MKIVLLHNLSHNYSAALIIAKIIADKYYEIAVDDRNKLLLQLSHENSCAIILCGIISKYFDEIPEQYRESILLTLAENSITAWDLSRIIAKKYDNVSDCVKNLLFKLSANEKTTAGVIWAIFENYNTLPPWMTWISPAEWSAKSSLKRPTMLAQTGVVGRSRRRAGRGGDRRVGVECRGGQDRGGQSR